MKRKLIAALLMATMATMVTGCGGAAETEATETTAATEAAAEESGVTTYKVVTSSVYAPFCYLNENEELDGFDVDVCKAIDELDDSIEFTYEWCDWASMLPGLDAGRYDLCTYQLSKNDDREAMYHFGELPYSNAAGAAIITTKDKANLTSWEALDEADAKVGVVVGGNFAQYTEDYLAEHPDAFEIAYYDSEIDTVMEDVVNGRIDCVINDGAVALEKAKANGNDEYLTVGGYVTEPKPVWFLYPKNELGEELSAICDKNLKTLYENGTLAEIAVKWLGDSYIIDTLADSGYFE